MFGTVTFDPAGNVSEWNEALLNFGSHFTQVTRGMRGGSWFGGGTNVTEFLAAASRLASECDGGGNQGCGSFARGFRVASVPNPIPEPRSLLLVTFAAVGLLVQWRRRSYARVSHAARNHTCAPYGR
jgi:hypothetical protein